MMSMLLKSEISIPYVNCVFRLTIIVIRNIVYDGSSLNRTAHQVTRAPTFIQCFRVSGINFSKQLPAADRFFSQFLLVINFQAESLT